jgi:hypothetical protein
MMFDGGGTPMDLFELDVCRRMGWTLSDLDEQDAARVMTGLALQHTRDALQNINRFLDSFGQDSPSEADLQVYDEVKKYMEEMNNE